MKPSTHIPIRVPADWRAAFEKAAKFHGLTLAEFLVESTVDRLPMAERKKLSKKQSPGRPKEIA